VVEVFLGLGSNIERDKHIRAGLYALQEQFEVKAVSSIYESDAIGFAGDPFLNLVVEIATSLPVGELQKALRRIENANGGHHATERFSPKTLDIDILLYGDVVGSMDNVNLPRDEILVNAFVLWPLAEIAPGKIHPGGDKTYAMLWSDFDRQGQVIRMAKHSHAIVASHRR
jgi:2-amino-4-hydroxy-6-hydroxymethyldihydropteridine diphosphokinase